jgi:hypothetical protein
MIKAGLGIGFFPEFSVTHPGLVARRLIDPEFTRSIIAGHRPRPPAHAGGGAFVQAARSFPWPPHGLTPRRAGRGRRLGLTSLGRQPPAGRNDSFSA